MRNPIIAEYRPDNNRQPVRLLHIDGSHTDLSPDAALFLAILIKKNFTRHEKTPQYQ